ncbi:hypothetical protein HDU93_009881, partial [Gonapodya sp. JEL0774]
MYYQNPLLSQVGGLAVGIPGEIAGLWELHSRYGSLPWPVVVEPAIKLAESGFRVSEKMREVLEYTKSMVLSDQQGFGATYAPHGTLLNVGDIAYRRNYGATLRQIALSGPSAVYSSNLTSHIVSYLNSKGGNVSVADFRDYFANVEEPMVGWYHGMKVVTAKPPASGAVLLAALTVLEGYNLRVEGPSPLNLHRIVEAWKFAYAYRSELGDPGRDGEYIANMSSTLERATDKQWGASTRARISDTATFPPSYYGSKFESKELPGTTSFSVLDENDMAVSVTLTVNLIFGAQIMDPLTGIVFNNQMDDFSWPN